MGTLFLTCFDLFCFDSFHDGFNSVINNGYFTCISNWYFNFFISSYIFINEYIRII